MDYPEFVVLKKKDGSGRIGVMAVFIQSIEETSDGTVVSITGSGNGVIDYRCEDTFDDVMKALNLAKA